MQTFGFQWDSPTVYFGNNHFMGWTAKELIVMARQYGRAIYLN